MSSQTRRRVLATISGTVAVGLAGCSDGGGDGATPTETEGSMETTDGMAEETDTQTETETAAEPAMLRVAHMAPDAPNVDVYVGEGDPVLTDVPFRAVSDYLEVPPGDYGVMITAAGDPDTVVFDDSLTVGDGAYTVVAAGELAEDGEDFAPLVLEDDLSDPGSDTARARIVHVSPDAPAVDVTVAATGDAIADGLAYRESGTVEVPADDYTLQVRGDTADNDGDVVAEFDLSLNGSTAYTVFAAGYLTPDDDPADEAFDLAVAQDASY
jgi:hypothetical protein